MAYAVKYWSEIKQIKDKSVFHLRERSLFSHHRGATQRRHAVHYFLIKFPKVQEHYATPSCMLLRAIWESSVVYMSLYQQVVCQIPCVTTPSWITANACRSSPGENDDEPPRPTSLSLSSFSTALAPALIPFSSFLIYLFLNLSPRTQQRFVSSLQNLKKEKRATSSSPHSSPLLWPSAGAGRGPGECGELNFHRVSHIVVTVWLTVKITLCSYRNPSTWI